MKLITLHRFLRLYVVRIIAIALAYYVTGRLGLLLAVPPGYATAVWPPSGVALAVILCLGIRYWPGVLLGSFGVNVFISFDPTDQETMLVSGGIAAIIACGATLQVIISSLLIKKHIQFPNTLERLRDIALLILLGGVVGCLINASISVTTMALTGAMPWENYLFNWLTWWVGDCIGVIVFTPPLILLLTPSPAGSATQKKIISSVLLFLFTVTVYVFFYASKVETAKQQNIFNEHAIEVVDRLNDNIQNYEDTMLNIQGFFAASEKVTAHEFRLFVERLFSKYPGIHALSFNKKVMHDERSYFESEMSQYISAEFKIKELDENKKLIPAAERHIYFPITYEEPKGYDGKALGYDTYSESERKQTLEDANQTGKLKATGRINVVQDEKNQYAFILYQPIYSNNSDKSTKELREKNLKGFAAGVFIFPEMLKEIHELARKKNLDFVLTDGRHDNTATLLFDSRTQNYKEPVQKIEKQKGYNFELLRTINIAGKQWNISVKPDAAYLATHQSWAVWFVLVGGLLFTGILGIFLLIITGRTALIEKMVLEKTQELKKLSNIIEESSDFVGMADMTGNLLYHNRSALKMIGKPVDHDISHMTISDMHPAWATKIIVNEAIPAALEHGTWQGETALLHSSGHEIPVLQNITVHKDDNGEPITITTIMRDISERKNNEIALRASEETFRTAMQYAVIGNALVSLDGKWLKVNNALCEMVGYTENELLQSSFQEITHPDDLEIDLAYVQQMLRKELKTYQMEKRYFHKDGEIVWVLLSVSLVWNEDGTPKYFISQIQNITQRKNTDLALNKALNELNLIFNHVSARIWFKDDKNTILRLNTAAAEAMDGKVEDFENRSMFDLFPDTAQTSYDDDLKVIRSGKPLLNSIEIQSPTSMQNSWVSTDKIPYTNEPLGLNGVLVVSRDITELKQAQEQREQLVAKLMESNTELERFAYVASHDMQEPLRMVVNFSNILAQDYAKALDNEGREYLALVSDSGKRMQEMIHDLLEYSRMDNGTKTLKHVDGALELKHALKNIQMIIDEKHAKVTFDSLPCFLGNPIQFMRLLQNLITNGIKYQPKENIPEIHIGAQEMDSEWLLSVHDNGSGIPPDFAVQIFQPFRRLHTWDHIKGTGLGLAICKKIVESHGGKIWVEAAPHQGSIFYFTIAKRNVKEAL